MRFFAPGMSAKKECEQRDEIILNEKAPRTANSETAVCHAGSF